MTLTLALSIAAGLAVVLVFALAELSRRHRRVNLAELTAQRTAEEFARRLRPPDEPR